MGVFVPTASDLLGINPYPVEIKADIKKSPGKKNNAMDIDRKFMSLRAFLNELYDGQTKTVEMLFVPPSAIIKTTPTWEHIKRFKADFISKNSVHRIMKYCTNQAERAVIKGFNLNKINKLIGEISKLKMTELNAKTSDWITGLDLNNNHYLREEVEAHILGIPIKIVPSVSKAPCISIGGKMWDINTRIKNVIISLRDLKNRYGGRSKNAANHGYDFKSLYHAYRLLFEAEELLTTTSLTFPRPEKEVTFLRELRQGLSVKDDHSKILKEKLAHLETNVLPNSDLPEKANLEFMDQFCYDLHRGSIQ
jgi:hypothetical protein